MATVNASVSTFMGMTDLASRGIGSGQTINRPSIPAFLGDAARSRGINYASAYFNSMLNNKSLGSVVSDYDSAKSSFQSEFKQAMGEAKKTGEALKNVDYRARDTAAGTQKDATKNGMRDNLNKLSRTANPINAVNEANATDGTNGPKDIARNEARGADTANKDLDRGLEDRTENRLGNTLEENTDSSTYTASLANDAMKTPPIPDATDTAEEISGLIGQYNDAVSYLQSKVGMSSQFDYFAASFNDTDTLMNTMEGIGVNVEPTGTLSVDTQALTKALEERPDSVEQALGAEGLAGQIERNTAAPDYQANRMFPAIDSVVGRPDDPAKGMYAPSMQISATMRGNSGRLMDMYY